jgi:hypothetical protein
MSTAYASTIIEAPLEKVWAHLRNFGGLASYQSSVARLSLQGVDTGDQVGSVRSVWLHEGKYEGKFLRERLLALSDADHSASYKVDIEDAPFENCIASFRLRPVTDRNATFIEWSTNFDAADLSAVPGLCGFIVNDIYADCFRGLKALVGAQ